MLIAGETSLNVYRGQLMSADELQLIKNNIGEFISINTFLSTTTIRSIAIDFSGNGCQRPQYESVLLHITIDLTLTNVKPYANISHLSSMEDENEILLSLGTVFTIDSVEIFNDELWLINLTLANHNNTHVKNILNHLRMRSFSVDDGLMFGLCLEAMDETQKAKQYYKILFDELPFNPLYTNELLNDEMLEVAEQFYVGNLTRLISDYEPYQTRLYDRNGVYSPNSTYEYKHILILHAKEQEFFETNSDIIDRSIIPDPAVGKMNMVFGLQLCRKAYFSDALKYFKLAIEIYHQVFCSFVHPELYFLFYFYGYLCYEKLDLDEAVARCCHALDIAQGKVDDVDIGIIYNILGLIFYEAEDYCESLIYFEMALDLLPSDHDIVVTILTDMGHLHRQDQNYQKALKYYNEALHIHTITVGILHNYIAIEKLLDHLGLTSIEAGDYENGIKYYNRLLEIQLEYRDVFSQPLATTYQRIAQAYRDMQQYTAAWVNCHKALKILLLAKDKSLESKIIYLFDFIKSLNEEKHDLEESFKNLDLIKDPQLELVLLNVDNPLITNRFIMGLYCEI
ncbi:unnamed protein product [Rotaria sp. Silwood2]|nr:unnamed protein product [Rotaria sp. Silwood2]